MAVFSVSFEAVYFRWELIGEWFFRGVSRRPGSQKVDKS